MRRWRLQELGDPIDQLRLIEEDPPTPESGEVLVATDAVGLAFPDVLQCRGEYQVPTPPGFTPGGETAGTVVDVGDGVTEFAEGDRVLCLGGGLREQFTIAPAALFPIPETVEATAAAALPVNYGTTWYALHECGRLQPGEWLLVTGAAGGTGTAAIQLGQAAGAKVVAVAGGDAKAGLVRDLGCDVVIDHHQTPDWVDAVREQTGGGVDVAYDPVGGDTFHQVRRCMNWGGRLLVIGFVGGIADAPTNHVLLKNYSIVGVHWGASVMRRPESVREQLGAVLDLAATGTVDPPRYPPYRFEDAGQALQDLADRQTWGKVVVTVD